MPLFYVSKMEKSEEGNSNDIVVDQEVVFSVFRRYFYVVLSPFVSHQDQTSASASAVIDACIDRDEVSRELIIKFSTSNEQTSLFVEASELEGKLFLHFLDLSISLIYAGNIRCL
ncbi:hypothetical protein EON65_08200 [archaeon]|nr:MAG: hypothetical protein EON65_08200 [archaeon]